MESKKIYNMILKIGVFVGILALVFLLWVGSSKITSIIKNDINTTEEAKIECEEIGGVVEREDEPLSPFIFECVGYDEDGFKFYWHKNENGDYYKTR